MSSHEKVVGLGLPLVDIKYPQSMETLPFPSNSIELLTFINAQEGGSWHVGGMIPNKLTAYARMHEDAQFYLLGCIGNDARGHFYQHHFEKKLNGLQIAGGQPTGFVAMIVDHDGSTLTARSFDGAVAQVKATPPEVIAQADMFITNANILRIPMVTEQANLALSILKKTGGVFVFSLGGAWPFKTTRETICDGLAQMPMQPHIVFGNEKEMKFIGESDDFQVAFDHLFRDARLSVMTRAEKGILLRFEGQTVAVPAYPVESGIIQDTQGAGDALTGVMLAELNEIPYHQWKIKDVIRAGRIANFAAAKVIISLHSQIQPEDVAEIRKYATDLKE